MSDFGTCRCGRPAEKTTSGVDECWRCWNRHKLDLPAARAWKAQVEQFLQLVDPYDLMMYFPACGLSKDDLKALSASLNKILDHSKEVIEWRPDSEQAPSTTPSRSGEA
jgi:hypothetical protein